MTDDKWDELCERLEGQYPELERFRENLPGEHAGFQEVLEFDGPVGRMRVVRVSKPAVTDIQHHYSHRQGATANTTYTYSDTDMTYRVVVYKEQDGDWQEMDATRLGL